MVLYGKSGERGTSIVSMTMRSRLRLVTGEITGVETNQERWVDSSSLYYFVSMWWNVLKTGCRLSSSSSWSRYQNTPWDWLLTSLSFLICFWRSISHHRSLSEAGTLLYTIQSLYLSIMLLSNFYPVVVHLSLCTQYHVFNVILFFDIDLEWSPVRTSNDCNL